MPDLLIKKIINEVVSKRYDDLSNQLRELAIFAVADTVSVGVAGWHELQLIS